MYFITVQSDFSKSSFLSSIFENFKIYSIVKLKAYLTTNSTIYDKDVFQKRIFQK